MQEAGVVNGIVLTRFSPHPAQGATTWTGGCCGMSREGSWRTSTRTRGCGSTPSARTPSSPKRSRYCPAATSLPVPHTAVTRALQGPGHKCQSVPHSQAQDRVLPHSYRWRLQSLCLPGVFSARCIHLTGGCGVSLNQCSSRQPCR